MQHTTRISATFDSATAATQAKLSLAPEAAELIDDRSQTTVSQAEEILTIRIEAMDLVALRAAINTWCGLLQVVDTVNAITDDGATT